MAELPTKEELEQLYHEKGHDALVWYAWRSALRTLPLLGRHSLHVVWQHDTVQNIYGVSRSFLVLAQWLNISIEQSSCTREAAKTARIAQVAAMPSTAGRTVAASTAAASSAVFYARKVTECVAAASKSAKASKAAAYITAARSDYAILRQGEVFGEDFWFRYPLWLMGITEPANYKEYQKKFLAELNNLGLAFLAKDLQCLWEMKPLSNDHAEKYLENLSDTITSDPIALREAILVKDGAEKLQTVRVLLLGPGGAGKSSLRDRLLGRSIEQSLNKDATTGVEYEWLDQSVLRDINPELKLDTQLNLRLWDFGGQTIFHGLHRAFLHENCVYVLVVDSRHEQAPDNWLYQIRDLTKNNLRVLVVTNRYDHCDTKQNETRLIREFPDLLKSTDQFFYFSCHQSDEPEFKDFIQTLVNQSMDSRHQVLKLAMDVQRKMQAEFEGKVFLEALQIEQLMPEHLVEKFHGTVVNHLDQLGYMIPVTNDGTSYCLKPEWAVKHAYDLVHSKALRDAKASASKITLQRMLKKKISLEEANFLIQFLESHHLCQKLDNNEYFFPDSAPADEPVAVHEIQNEKEALALRFDLPFLPLGIHTRFIHQLFKSENAVRIPDTKAIWRQGFLLECDGARASVQYQWCKSCIEIRMVGEVERFADILEAFDTALDAVLESGVLQRKEIQPYVVYGEGQVYSIHSSLALTEKLRKITHIDQLFPEVQAMAGSDKSGLNVHGDYYEIKDSDGLNLAGRSKNSKLKSKVDKSVTTFSTQHLETINTVLDELLEQRQNLSKQQTRQVIQVQDALEAEVEATTEEGQSRLNTVYQELKSIIGATNDGIGVAKEVAANWPAITGWLTATAATLQQLG